MILSSLPWHDAFYRLLNRAAELVATSADDGELWRFLEACHKCRPPPPSPGTDPASRLLRVAWRSAGEEEEEFSCPTPPAEGLPSIPENVSSLRNHKKLHNLAKTYFPPAQPDRVLQRGGGSQHAFVVRFHAARAEDHRHLSEAIQAIGLRAGA